MVLQVAFADVVEDAILLVLFVLMEMRTSTCVLAVCFHIEAAVHDEGAQSKQKLGLLGGALQRLAAAVDSQELVLAGQEVALKLEHFNHCFLIEQKDILLLLLEAQVAALGQEAEGFIVFVERC